MSRFVWLFVLSVFSVASAAHFVFANPCDPGVDCTGVYGGGTVPSCCPVPSTELCHLCTGDYGGN